MTAWRTSPLPPDWRRIRAEVIARDGQCTWPLDGTPHGGPLEVDHVGDRTDHRLANLRALCKRHHLRRTASQGGQANARRRTTRRRPADRHPGDHVP